MKIDYGLPGEKRKGLVRALSRITGERAIYQGTPSCAYKIGDLIVTRTGELEGDITPEIIEKLKGWGYRPQGDMEESVEDLSYLREEMRMAACVPRKMLKKREIKILRDFVESKKSIFMRMFNTDDLSIDVNRETISFPWFPSGGREEQKAYIDFIEKLCAFVKTINEVRGKDYILPSERYHGRRVLLRLGFVGKQYERDRQILLQYLTGDTTCPYGRPPLYKARKKKKEVAL